ncbi:MAG: hypothetical protein AB7I18_01355 [Candidatus Berkiella sp.]
MESTKRDLHIIIGYLVLFLVALYGFAKPYLESNKYLRTAKSGYVYIMKNRSLFMNSAIPYQIIYFSEISNHKIEYYVHPNESSSVDQIKASWPRNDWSKDGFDFKSWRGPFEMSRWTYDHLDLITRLKPAPENLEGDAGKANELK